MKTYQFDLFDGSPDLNEQEHTFINLCHNHPTLQFARQNYVNKRFNNKFFSLYEGCHVVGFTLNRTKTKVIRIFFNKGNDSEGDRVVESVKYPIQFSNFP